MMIKFTSPFFVSTYPNLSSTILLNHYMYINSFRIYRFKYCLNIVIDMNLKTIFSLSKTHKSNGSKISRDIFNTYQQILAQKLTDTDY